MGNTKLIQEPFKPSTQPAVARAFGQKSSGLRQDTSGIHTPVQPAGNLATQSLYGDVTRTLENIQELIEVARFVAAAPFFISTDDQDRYATDEEKKRSSEAREELWKLGLLIGGPKFEEALLHQTSQALFGALAFAQSPAVVENGQVVLTQGEFYLAQQKAKEEWLVTLLDTATILVGGIGAMIAVVALLPLVIEAGALVAPYVAEEAGLMSFAGRQAALRAWTWALANPIVATHLGVASISTGMGIAEAGGLREFSSDWRNALFMIHQFGDVIASSPSTDSSENPQQRTPGSDTEIPPETSPSGGGATGLPEPPLVQPSSGTQSVVSPGTAPATPEMPPSTAPSIPSPTPGLVRTPGTGWLSRMAQNYTFVGKIMLGTDPEIFPEISPSGGGTTGRSAPALVQRSSGAQSVVRPGSTAPTPDAPASTQSVVPATATAPSVRDVPVPSTTQVATAASGPVDPLPAPPPSAAAVSAAVLGSQRPSTVPVTAPGQIGQGQPAAVATAVGSAQQRAQPAAGAGQGQAVRASHSGTQPSAAPTVVVASHSPDVDQIVDSYRAATQGTRDIVNVTDNEITYVFDVTKPQAGRNVANRVIVVYGVSGPSHGARDKSRMAGHPNPFGVDRGHLASRGQRGGYDINLAPQDPRLNRGWSLHGREWRAIERYLADNPGTHFVVRLIYTDDSDWADRFEYSVRQPDGQWRTTHFDNPRPAR